MRKLAQILALMLALQSLAPTAGALVAQNRQGAKGTAKRATATPKTNGRFAEAIKQLDDFAVVLQVSEPKY